ncbi:hypothetical protein H0H81_002529 [Sphagnurus paluster]|uniref:DUF7598 domain-containing protein n=1 Tax=Sphagnurus paluster TaxID=117069 RepID=A0A9P7K6I3_9AGAR|nr:hypothetical protein H0H81_002529 [Sphagnurus paluster]
MGLNGVRFISAISLILVFASSMVILVNNINAWGNYINSGGPASHQDCDYIEGSTIPNQPAGAFWSIVASFLVIFQTIVLFLSELSWPEEFFATYFPVLSRSFGLGPLGIFQCLTSTQVLSHHVDDFPLVSAFFLFAVGCLNMLLGLIFRESAKERRSITSWRAESKAILPTSATGPMGGASVTRQYTGDSKHSYSSRPDTAEFRTWRSTDNKAGYGFGRQGEKAAGLRGFILQRPEESLPRYATPVPAHHASTYSYEQTLAHSEHEHEAEGHEEHDITLKRSPSVVSSSSSFAAPYRESTQTATDAGHTRGVRAPVFKSSSTAL